jgi:hypothetical protein
MGGGSRPAQSRAGLPRARAWRGDERHVRSQTKVSAIWPPSSCMTRVFPPFLAAVKKCKVRGRLPTSLQMSVALYRALRGRSTGKGTHRHETDHRRSWTRIADHKPLVGSIGGQLRPNKTGRGSIRLRGRARARDAHLRRPGGPPRRPVPPRRGAGRAPRATSPGEEAPLTVSPTGWAGGRRAMLPTCRFLN